MEWNLLFKEALFFLILINPISKAVIVNMLPKNLKIEKIGRFLVRASIIALVLLVVFAFAGRIILSDIFRIDINALRMAGGFVLAIIGFKALDKGIMFQMDQHTSLWDLAIVPMASPLIAGPATITAAIVESATYTAVFISLAIIMAIVLNLFIMYMSLRTQWVLKKYNFAGAIIRIFGLFIMAIGVHMMLTGIKEFFHIG
jgi:multiple antibiotic resistance protein